jgi:hypothetical protein
MDTPINEPPKALVKIMDAAKKIAKKIVGQKILQALLLTWGEKTNFFVCGSG